MILRPALALLALALAAVGAGAHTLAGSEWGFAGESGAGARFVNFSGGGRLFGSGGCNRFSGTFEQDGDMLTISPLAATRRACDEAVMGKEQAFFDLLARTRGVSSDGKELRLLDGAGAEIAVLVRRDPD